MVLVNGGFLHCTDKDILVNSSLKTRRKKWLEHGQCVFMSANIDLTAFSKMIFGDSHVKTSAVTVFSNATYRNDEGLFRCYTGFFFFIII